MSVSPAQPVQPVLPLSHHRLLALVAPFVRAGLVLDTAATDRAAGRVAFAPREVPAAGETPAHTERWMLQPASERGADWQLLRTLQAPGLVSPLDGAPLRAVVEASGDDPAALREAVAAVPASSAFLTLPAPATGPAALQLRIGPEGAPLLREAQAPVAGLVLRMTVSGVKGYPAELKLQRAETDTRALPDDLFEVLGRGWTRLTRLRTGWDASVMLRGTGAARSEHATRALRQAVAHLAQTLAEPPARFHQRHTAARWRVGLLRGLPLSVGLAVVAVAFAVRGRGDAAESTLAALANLVPPLLMALFFMRREMPRIELPRPPRRPPATAWQPWPAPAGAPTEPRP